MLRDEGVAMIQEQMGFRVILATSIINYMKLAQVTLEKGPTKPWFLIGEEEFTTTTADEERVSLPLNFIQEVDSAMLKYRPDEWPDEPEVDLVKEDYDTLRKNFAGVESGPPEAYSLLGNYLRMFPLPDAVYTLRWIYYKPGVVLDTNVENEWLKEVPLLLLGTAGRMMTNASRDKAAYEMFGEWIAAGQKILMAHDVSRDMANRDMQIGGPAV